jgi:hypothetical protein
MKWQYELEDCGISGGLWLATVRLRAKQQMSSS